jgi:hypothetical protein
LTQTVTYEFRPELWVNNGRGFQRSTWDVELPMSTAHATNAVVMDYDLDGREDLLVPYGGVVQASAVLASTQSAADLGPWDRFLLLRGAEDGLRMEDPNIPITPTTPFDAFDYDLREYLFPRAIDRDGDGRYELLDLYSGQIHVPGGVANAPVPDLLIGIREGNLESPPAGPKRFSHGLSYQKLGTNALFPEGAYQADWAGHT